MNYREETGLKKNVWNLSLYVFWTGIRTADWLEISPIYSETFDNINQENNVQNYCPFWGIEK
jgi:hypothetical protein